MLIEHLPLIGSFVGGLGLFLLAINMMTDGLRQAAGSALRTLLASWTSTPMRGVMSGFLMTAIVQSSSAITVASIGFVNAGLLSMNQALGVIYGANVGTTITAWLVAMIGFKLDIQVFALPMIGLGMMLQLVRKNSPLASAGMALAGFGIFIFGIDILRMAFEGIISAFDISKFTVQGPLEILLFLLVGIVMTILTQSSSASIALTITAAATGIVGIYAAASMVIGANVGTTSTALLAVIGATANAKRVALAQVMFNVATALVALLILPLLFFAIQGLEQFLGLAPEPGVTLALFHSVFNLLGVALVLPFNNRLVRFLEQRFMSRAETELLPRYLDRTIASTPVLAINALVLELQANADRVRQLAAVCLDPGAGNQVHKQLHVIRHLSAEISRFIVELERTVLSAESTNHLIMLLRVDQYLLSCAINIDRIQAVISKLEPWQTKIAVANLHEYQAQMLALMQGDASTDFDMQLSCAQDGHDGFKARMLEAGAKGDVDFDTIVACMEMLGEWLRLVQHWIKAMKQLAHIATQTTTSAKPVDEGSTEGELLHRETVEPDRVAGLESGSPDA
jgi:phosphate:Na+ symporter